MIKLDHNQISSFLIKNIKQSIIGCYWYRFIDYSKKFSLSLSSFLVNQFDSYVTHFEWAFKKFWSLLESKNLMSNKSIKPF